jgi:hypothetical protein
MFVPELSAVGNYDSLKDWQRLNLDCCDIRVRFLTFDV